MFFLYMQKNFVRKYTSPTKNKVNSFLAISESNTTERFILFHACCTFWYNIKYFFPGATFWPQDGIQGDSKPLEWYSHYTCINWKFQDYSFCRYLVFVQTWLSSENWKNGDNFRPEVFFQEWIEGIKFRKRHINTENMKEIDWAIFEKSYTQNLSKKEG